MLRNRLRLAAAIAVVAAHASKGIFEGKGDVGAVLHPGSVEYDAARGTYRLTGSGENMWFGADAFYFAWKKVSGDVSITADITFSDHHRQCAQEGRAAGAAERGCGPGVRRRGAARERTDLSAIPRERRSEYA